MSGTCGTSIRIMTQRWPHSTATTSLSVAVRDPLVDTAPRAAIGPIPGDVTCYLVDLACPVMARGSIDMFAF